MVRNEVQVSAGLWDRLIEREPVRVTYLPDRPRANRIEGVGTDWMLPGIFTLLGLVFVPMGGWIFAKGLGGVRRQLRLQTEGTRADATVVDVGPANVRFSAYRLQNSTSSRASSSRGRSRTMPILRTIRLRSEFVMSATSSSPAGSGPGANASGGAVNVSGIFAASSAAPRPQPGQPVLEDAERPPARQQGRSSGATNRQPGYRVDEITTLTRQPVEVGCPCIGIAGESKRLRTPLVGNDEDDVRLRLSLVRGR